MREDLEIKKRIFSEKLKIVILIGFLITSFSKPGYSSGEITGYMFGDFYYVTKHHDESIEGSHGFWFRRIYFTYNNKISDKIKIRLRLEFNSPGDFKSSKKLTPAVKDAWLSYKLRNQELLFGIIPTPAKENVEKIWGYRSVEKTPLDLQKLLSSRDFGIALKGNLDSGGKISYKVMFGNGASNKGETDKGKKIYGALAYKPLNGLLIETYGDYEAQKNNKKFYVLQVFGAYENDRGRVGILYARRHLDQKTDGGENRDHDYDIFSAFGVVNVTQNIDIIARYDRMFGDGFESNFSGQEISYVPFADNPGAPFNLVMGGIGWQAAKNVWIVPNVKYVFYDSPARSDQLPKDLYLNFTVFFKY